MKLFSLVLAQAGMAYAKDGFEIAPDGGRIIHVVN